MLEPEELSRYSRQYILPEIGVEGQQKLKDASVLVVGAGGLGCPVLLYLAAAGIGSIGIVDFDKVDQSNLQRQILYSTEDIGKSKAKTAAERLSLQNPWIKFKVFDEKLSTSNAQEIIKDFDIVVDGSDNFTTRYIVNDACILSGKPLVFGSIYKYEGQVSVFNFEEGGSYRCLFPEGELNDEMANCAIIGVLGVLPGIIGTLQANEVLKIILGIGQVLSGKLLVVDALSLQFHTYTYQKNPANFILQKMPESITDWTVSAQASNFQNEEISVQELARLIATQAEIQLLDVREPDEYARKNIGGLHVPLGMLKHQTTKLKKEHAVVVYCQSGIRSREALRLLVGQFGFTNVRNLRGGLNAWYAAHN